MNNFKKEFVSYEEALELKQLGFDEPCMGEYNLTIAAFDSITMRCAQIHNNGAPLFQQAFRWFRKKGYRFSVIMDSPLAEEESHYIEIWFEKQFLHESHYIYKTYEDGELGLLKKLIQYEKEKQQ